VRLCAILILVVVAVACPRAAEATHREDARAILESHCGLCHLPASEPEFEGLAIHIFDLTQKDWSATLSDAQLDEVVKKLVDDGAPDDEVRALERFVADELKWRDLHRDNYSVMLRDRGLLNRR
jgi:hypothetical protein